MSKAFHDFERSGWQRAAPHYADAFGSITSQAIPALVDAVGAAPGVRLLDVATGPGYVAAEAAARGARATGVDFSSQMIELARRRYPDIEFEEGDAEELPFVDGTFGAVAMNFGLLHLARPDAALAEARRVLQGGGRFGFTVWARPELAIGFGIVLSAVETHGRTDVTLPEGPPFFRFSDAAECVRSLTAAGFVDPRVETLPLVWRPASADAVFDAFSQGAVRTAALLRAQAPAALEAIRRAIHDEVDRYRRGGSIGLPMAAMLATGSKK